MMFRAGALETVDRRLRRNAATVKLVRSKWEKREVFNLTAEILLKALGKAQCFIITYRKIQAWACRNILSVRTQAK